MKITVTGLGYLGLTHAVAMTQLGHEVLGIENDPEKLQLIQKGITTFYEPGLQQAMSAAVESGLLKFQQNIDSSVANYSLHFICVGTPQSADGLHTDTSAVMAVGKQLARHISPDSVVVGKSTVPVETARQLQNEMAEASGLLQIHLAWNPEFLREGTALQDSLEPNRIVIGSDSEHAQTVLVLAYRKILTGKVPLFLTSLETAELVKVAANAFLATKLSFINAIASMCNIVGADVQDLSRALGADERIGSKYLQAGIGFGGACLPKDLSGLQAKAGEMGLIAFSEMLDNVQMINEDQKIKPVQIVSEELGDLTGKRIAVLGLSFKPNSDDLRESPALQIALDLVNLGAHVVAHDPQAKTAMDWLKRADTPAEAVKGADAVLCLTDWAEYKTLDPETLDPAHRLVIDGRNMLDRARWHSAGWRIYQVGRGL